MLSQYNNLQRKLVARLSKAETFLEGEGCEIEMRIIRKEEIV